MNKWTLEKITAVCGSTATTQAGRGIGRDYLSDFRQACGWTLCAHRLFRGSVTAVLGASLVLAGFAAPSPASAGDGEKLEVVTTLAVLADLVRTVGGERVNVSALSDPRQDPHFVQPRPTLMKKARDAGAFIEIGLQLELWGDKVVDGSGNTRIQTGAPGRIVASAGISTLELPRVVSREWGDVHPDGNPHVWLDPLRAKQLAANIAGGLARLDPGGADFYGQRARRFQDKIDAAVFGADLVDALGGAKLNRLADEGRLGEYLADAGLADKLGGWMGKAAPLRGLAMVTYHKTWVYFASRFGMTIPVEIEERPGIAPSAKHRDQVVDMVRERKIPLVVQASFYDRSAADYISTQTGVPVVSLPIQPGVEPGTDDYFGFMDYLVDTLVKTAAGG